MYIGFRDLGGCWHIARFRVGPKTRLRWPFWFYQFIKSFVFSVKCLGTWYIFSGSASLLALSVFLFDPLTEAIMAIIFIIHLLLLA